MASVRNTIHRLGEEDVSQIVEVLSESFYDYPVMRYVLGPETGEYEERLKALVSFFAMARIHREEILLGIGDRTDLDGVALISRPDTRITSTELDEHRDQLWTGLGSTARRKYEAFGAACAQFQIDVPHIHLNMIGVCQRAQGEGLGGKLLEHIHGLSADDRVSEGVTLNTEDARNVSLYERFGYRVVGHAAVTPELETWCFFRPN